MTPTAPASIASDEVPADLVERFAAALKRLRPGEERIGLAVSGGPDSMAMLLLAHAAVPGEFEVATVNHGLRPEAAEECALVERACASRDIACTVLRVEVGSGNLQAEAREARYHALATWAKERKLSAIATAHHADDQAETLLMRLNRGSGVSGLAGVRERVRVEELDALLIRPALGFRRAELAAVIQEAGIEAAGDPSNTDEGFARVRTRKALATSDWLDPLALAKSAAHMAEAEEALAHFTAQIWSRCVSREDGCVTFCPEGPRVIRLRIIERVIGVLGSLPRGGDVARLLDSLEEGKGGNVGGVLATVRGGAWIFRPEPPRRTG
jgi:tRNA(Ile)-lysidine synthase